MAEQKVEPKRAKSMVGCPGCMGVDGGGKECAPGNLTYCTVSQALQPSWKPGNCVGCKRLAAELPCAQGNAALCAIAWSRNR